MYPWIYSLLHVVGSVYNVNPDLVLSRPTDSSIHNRGSASGYWIVAVYLYVARLSLSLKLTAHYEPEARALPSTSALRPKLD